MLERNIKIKHLLLGAAVTLLLLGIGFWFTREFWGDQARAHALGSIEAAAEKYGWGLREFDRLEISVIGTNGMTVFQKVLASEEAKEFRRRWRAMSFSGAFSALCHEPAYRLRFFEGKELLLDTTLCWKCSNFSVPTLLGEAYCGFDEKSVAAQGVWELLQKHAPVTEARQR